jgi:hypothetical protein
MLKIKGELVFLNKTTGEERLRYSSGYGYSADVTAELQPTAVIFDRHRRRHRRLEEIANALRANGGFISQTAKALGMTQRGLEMRIASSQVLQDVKREITEEYVDYAESQLLRAVENGEAWAITFFLRHKGRERGYVETPLLQANVTGGSTLEMIDSFVHDEE